MSKRITVVTPWWNHRDLERDYWAAISQVDAQVIVVDNGSDPPLPNALRLETNMGFAYACNRGLEAARSEAVLFLNNDIAPAGGDWLAGIRAALEPGVLVGANLRNDPHAAVDGVPFPYLDGWCLAGMRDDLLELGGFDESFDEPAYYGDNDLCLRARAAGMTLREAPDTARLLIHKRNVTAGPGHDPRVHAATVANRARYEARARELIREPVAA